MNTNPTPTSFLGDPLSEPCRKERRNLLAAGIIGFLIAKVELVPTEISGLGISLTGDDQQAFVFLLAFVIGYFFVAFVLYGVSDFMIFRKNYHDYIETVESHMDSWIPDDQQNYDELKKRVGDISWVYQWSKPAAIARAAFEFLLPLVVGIYAVVALIWQ